MKKRMLLAAGAVLVAATVSAFVYVKNESSSMDGLFNANVEALAGPEIIVGPLCMVAPNYLCHSLGVYYADHWGK